MLTPKRVNTIKKTIVTEPVNKNSSYGSYIESPKVDKNKIYGNTGSAKASPEPTRINTIKKTIVTEPVYKNAEAAKAKAMPMPVDKAKQVASSIASKLKRG